MKVKVVVLAPVITDSGGIVTNGVIEMDAERADAYCRDGLIDIVERDGKAVFWLGCCDHE